MRVLFTCVVGYGHFHPMVPLAHALERAGHSVSFATDPRFCGYVREVGFEADEAGLDQPEALARFVAATPGWAGVPLPERMSLLQPGLFGRVRVPPMLRDLARVIDDRQPDLVIHDSAEMAGAIAAEVAELAHAEHAFGVLRPAAVRRAATDALAPISDELGVRNPGVGGIGGELYLDICPPGIQHPEITAVPNVQPMRPIGFDEGPNGGLPGWVSSLPEQPTVYVTLGTVFNEVDGVFAAILDAVRGEPLNAVVTVGLNGNPEMLGPQPGNVHVERYIPQSRLLPLCDAFVSHCGSGALLGAINAGVPMLAVPQGADQFMNAERVLAAGIGLRLMPEGMGSDAVREAIASLIADDRFRRNAAAAHSATLQMPTPDEVVPVLEDLVASHGPG